MTKLRHDQSDAVPEPLIPPKQLDDHPSRSDFDLDGIPNEAQVADWLDLPQPLDSQQLQAILRYSRPDGSIVFGPIGRSSDRLRRLDKVASSLNDPSLSGLLARWLPSSQSSTIRPSPPPLPSDSRPDRVLAILRADWTSRGDLIAIDHRQPGLETLLEVGSKGQVWLGPVWTSAAITGKPIRPEPSRWTTTPFAHSLEWSFKIGSTQVTRVATLLRGRSMAILAQQLEGTKFNSELRLSLAPGIEATFIPGSRALQLKSGPGKPCARLLALSLPDHDRPTDCGSIAVEGREVVIRQNHTGRNYWLPLLLSWDKPPTVWRPVTVAYRSKASTKDQAVAVRVAWGSREPGLVVYRSLEPPELRSFLGHQTTAKFLVGSFTRSGDVTPILKVDA